MKRVLAFFTIKGRARRRDYGAFFLVTLVVYLAACIPDFIRLYSTYRNVDGPVTHQSFLDDFGGLPRAALVGTIIIGVLIALVLYAAWIAMCVRRLHDLNVAGGFAILCVVVSLFPGLGYLLASLVLGLWPGTKGPNAYGPDPRRPLALADVFGPGDSADVQY